MSEYRERITKLQQFLIAQEIDVAVFNLNSDLYYYSGSVQPLYMVIPAEGTGVLIARKSLERIRSEAPLFTLETFQNTRDLQRIVADYGWSGARKIGFTLENTAYATVMRWMKLFEGAVAVDISWEIRRLRMVKSEAEHAIFREAGRRMAELPRVIRESFRPGMTELELSAAIENFMRLNGHGGLSRCRREGIEMNYGVCSGGAGALAGTKFDGICGGEGLDRAVPYGASWKPIGPGEPVIIDFAFVYQGYHLDQTRMFCWGEPQPEVVKALDAMCQVERFIAERLVPGAIWSELYDGAVQLAEKLGYAESFMGLGPEKVKFVGHGVGLELDEPPYLAPKMNEPLEAGMVLALEPKVALPGIGVIGNEDTVIVTESGVEWATVAAKEMIVIPS